jgi:hypothetical protein
VTGRQREARVSPNDVLCGVTLIVACCSMWHDATSLSGRPGDACQHGTIRGLCVPPPPYVGMFLKIYRHFRT